MTHPLLGAPPGRRWVRRGLALLLAVLPVVSVGCLLNPSATEVPNDAPLVVAVADPDSGVVPLTVSFNGMGSDRDGEIVSYRWEFGDGTSSDQLHTQHIYTQPGDFTATLVATDDRGASAVAQARVRPRGRANQRPTATISATPRSGVAPLRVSFTGTATDPDGTVNSFAWLFGDGIGSTEQNPSHTFSSAGNYSVRLTVTDNGGATASDQIQVNVTSTQNVPPTASATATPMSGPAPLTVVFTGTGSDADGSIASYVWTFGDGGTSTIQSPSHTYTTAGSYTARLTVTDNGGATASATVAISASGTTNLAPVANAGVDQLNKDPGTTITLTGAGSSDPDGSITSYAWTQIAGPTVTLTGGNTATPTFKSPTGTSASYEFRLTVTDNGSPARTASDNVLVSTRITYANLVGALFLARGTQSNGELLGCTSSGCHTGTNSRAPLSTYAQVYSARSGTRSRIQPNGSMASFLAAGEAAIITAWIDAGAPEKN